MSGVELFARTYYSFLEGASRPDEMIQRAHDLRMDAIGVSDRNGVYGIPKAFWARKQLLAKDGRAPKLLVGAEGVMADGLPSLRWIARSRKGYGLLCRILTRTHAGLEKGEGQLSWRDLVGLLDKFPAASEELFVFPSVDLRGDVWPERVQGWSEAHLAFLTERFKDRVFLPLLRLEDGREEEATRSLRALSDRYAIPIVATSLPHHHVPERRRVQDVLTATRLQKPLKECGYALFGNSARHLRDPSRVRELYRDLPEAIQAAERIAADCSFCPSELRYRYPSEWIPAGHTAQSYLEECTWAGAAQRYGGSIPPEVAAQLRHELELIRKLEFADYFLTIYEIVLFARSRGILCQGRGSAANSAVCYCLGITAIDPVRMDLLFERFISVERGEPPDIDVDFEHERREEVLQHIYEKYGRDRAAMVSAVVTYRSRSAFRDVAKALGVEVGTLSARSVKREFEQLALKSDTVNVREKIDLLCEEIEGFPRHLSIHSGGFTLSADPMIELVPIEPARMEGRTIIQWDKYDLDYLGLLKVDILSLGMLTAVHKTLRAIGRELHEIPPEDPATYAMIQAADTVGVFQIESRAQMGMLGRLVPLHFYDLVVEVAIMRPGPIQGGMVHPYLRRRRGLEPVTYPHPKVEKILKKTLGVPLFQEQVMKLASELAGFSGGEADQLRRAVGGWRSDGGIQKMAERLMRGLIQSGLPASYAQQIFDQIQGFGAYGFPESHAASFALIAYVTSYLKCHHPAEFVAALLNSQPMGFYAPHTLIDDAKRHGVQFLPVSPNHSEWDYALEGAGRVRMGLRSIFGLAKSSADHWVCERKARHFEDLRDFVTRTDLRADVLHRLALAGVFEDLGWPRPREALWEVLKLRNYEFPGEAPMQFDLFKNPNAFERVLKDYAATGASARGHPMSALRALGYPLGRYTSGDLSGLRHGQSVEISGVIILRQRPPTAKGMMFASLEDEFGIVDLVVRPQLYAECQEIFHFETMLTLKGVLQRDGNSKSVLVRSVQGAT